MAQTPAIYHYRGEEDEEVPNDMTHVHVDEKVTEIDAYTFNNCQSLKNVELPEGLVKIGSCAFQGCLSLEVINLPSNLTSIGERAFQRCDSLLRIQIPSTVADIGNYAFSRCSTLMTVDLREGLQKIGDSAFRCCTSLLTVNIPYTVTDIGHDAFLECSFLRTVMFREGLQTIKSHAFGGCNSLLRLTIPTTVTEIGHGAFFGCSVLNTVKLHEGLQTMGEGAFEDCTSLLSVGIPSTVTDIGCRAFYGCTELRTVKLHEGIQTIAEGAFEGCRSLIRVNIPSTVTEIGKEAFKDCFALRTVKLHEGLQTIGEWAFFGCESLISVNIPSTVTDIDNNAFHNCRFLRNISVSQSTDVGQQTFPSLQNLDCSIDEVRGRFNELSVHRLCFGEPYESTENVLSRIEEEVNKPGTHGLFQDCLGMTPIHCLACSENYDIELYKLLAEKYPDALIKQDKWGTTPLEYAILNEVPADIIGFLFQMHCNKWKEMPFDFGAMVQNLVSKHATSAEFLRCIIRAQRDYFSEVEIDWDGIVTWSAHHFVHFKVFLVLVEANVSKRLVCMSSEHQTEVMTRVDALEIGEAYAYEDIWRWVTNYARMYKEHLKEATSILELALWKNGLEELRESRNQGRCNLRKKAKISNPASRGECRKGCPAQVVIPNVLAFL